MQRKIIELMQRRIGSTSVGASTARGMGPPGTIQAARAYLQRLDLGAFSVSSRWAFEARLDEATIQLQAALPQKAQHWGTARKFLNIFLRGCTYNRYLCAQYKFRIIEKWLELPLDSHTAKGLKARDAFGTLPRWKTVIGLTKQQSDIFQEFAKNVAAREKTLPVHLDLLFWRADN